MPFVIPDPQAHMLKGPLFKRHSLQRSSQSAKLSIYDFIEIYYCSKTLPLSPSQTLHRGEGILDKRRGGQTRPGCLWVVGGQGIEGWGLGWARRVALITQTSSSFNECKYQVLGLGQASPERQAMNNESVCARGRESTACVHMGQAAHRHLPKTKAPF